VRGDAPAAAGAIETRAMDQPNGMTSVARVTRSGEPNGSAKPNGGAVSSPRRRPCVAPVQPLLIDMATVAALLQLSLRTVKRRAASGEIPGRCRPCGIRRALFSRVAIEDWVAKGCPPFREKR
jgi:hypothetical protein